MRRDASQGLGNGPGYASVATPTRVEGLSDIKKVQAGQYTLALANDKTLWFWGSLGNELAYVPTKVLDPTAEDPNRIMTDVEDISGTCLRFSNGNVRCLPSSVQGKYRFNPVPRVTNAVAISGTCALDAEGRLRCWGDNYSGQLGVPPQQQSSANGSVEIDF